MAASRETSGLVTVLGYSIDFLRELGRGGFGTVYRGYDDDGNSVAIKKSSKSDMQKASNEAVKFHYLKDNILHGKIIKVYDVKTWEDSMWIMMEYCAFGDINYFFKKYYQKFDTRIKLNIMGQISKGVAFLHHRNIVHRDIKPGNILVKGSDGYAVVKLGDFGLSRFLDPDDITSAMSSNVGTQCFKAPEFWDTKPNDTVNYHRNVDVYAAGLTFTSMLQAKPDQHSLVAKVADPLQPFEAKMPIGFAAFTRCQNKHDEIRVVVPGRNDTLLLIELKSIIEAMICFSPEARIATAEVKKQIAALGVKFTEPETQLTFISRFQIGRVCRPTTMCYINNNLVMHVHQHEKDTYETQVYDETGNLVKEWKPCHVLPSMMGFEIHGKEYLLEGCTVCEMIRSYVFSLSKCKILCSCVSPKSMCKGPDGTILVFDRIQKNIKQLRFSKGQLHLAEQFSAELEEVCGLCYSDKLSLAILLHCDGKAITGISLATGKIAWQHTEIRLVSSPKGQNLYDVVMLPDGTVCVFSYREIFALDPMDGRILCQLLDLKDKDIIWTVTACQKGNQQKLAIAHATELSIYEIPFQAPDAYGKLPLRDIISDEASVED